MAPAAAAGAQAVKGQHTGCILVSKCCGGEDDKATAKAGGESPKGRRASTTRAMGEHQGAHIDSKMEG